MGYVITRTERQTRQLLYWGGHNTRRALAEARVISSPTEAEAYAQREFTAMPWWERRAALSLDEARAIEAAYAL